MQKLASKFMILSFLSCLGLYALSQNNLASDILAIKKIKVDVVPIKKEIRPFVVNKESSLLIKYNPVALSVGGLLFFYQNVLSQQFSATCLYNPSCSEFSKLSIREYGLVKGIFLSADRVTRCNRIAATGIHPIRVENNKVADPVEFYRIK